MRARKSGILALERADARTERLDLLRGLCQLLANVTPYGERRQIREKPKSLDAIARVRLAALGAPLEARAAPADSGVDVAAGAADLARAESLDVSKTTAASRRLELLSRAVAADPSLAVSAAAKR